MRQLILAAAVVIASISAAHAGKKTKEEAKEPERPGLTGAKILRCDAGYYAAGNNCKPARPGTYVIPGSNYPISCPSGTTSPQASRSLGECTAAK